MGLQGRLEAGATLSESEGACPHWLPSWSGSLTPSRSTHACHAQSTMHVHISKGPEAMPSLEVVKKVEVGLLGMPILVAQDFFQELLDAGYRRQRFIEVGATCGLDKVQVLKELGRGKAGCACRVSHMDFCGATGAVQVQLCGHGGRECEGRHAAAGRIRMNAPSSCQVVSETNFEFLKKWIPCFGTCIPTSKEYEAHCLLESFNV